MCVAVPGKVIEINGNIAKINMMGNVLEANISLTDANVGDYVLIHAGCVLQVMNKDAAEELLSVFGELEETMSDDNS